MNKPDALLIVSYGGPERLSDVEPFLNRVLHNKKIPEVRRQAALQKYYQMNGRSPIQEECRTLIQALSLSIRKANDQNLPFVIYWGNLYAPPFLSETIHQMKTDGIQSFVFFPTSSFGTPQSCQRYLYAVQKSFQELESMEGFEKTVERSLKSIDFKMEATPLNTRRFIVHETAFSDRPLFSDNSRMNFVKTPLFLNHPSYLRASADALLAVLANDLLDHCFSENLFGEDNKPLILFSAHSLTLHDAETDHYREQLEEHCQKVIQMIQPSDHSLCWQLAFQSRSGSPQERWTEPNIEDAVRQYKEQHPDWNRLIVSPIGFFLENMETVYDLDISLAQTCRELKISFCRVPTFGNNPRVVEMIVNFLRNASDLKSNFQSCLNFCDLSCLVDSQPFSV